MPQKRSKSTSSRRSRPVRTRPRAERTAAGASGDRSSAAPPRPLPAGRLEAYARLLLEERRRLREELSEMEEHQVKTEEKPVADVSGYEDDLVDVATETFEREKGLALESSVQGLLEMVEEALKKIRKGTYGICEGCGQQIDANRLRAIPYARLCIRCKEREERLRSVAR
ncbi:MAG TPA: TraR/DksA C4-type zinc finger protein [bacterium]|nr:TraR/DksA C4-type zinc finger protein [bacterium]